MPIVPYGDLKPCGISPVYNRKSISVDLAPKMVRQSYWWGFMGVASDIPGRKGHTANSDPMDLITLLTPLYGSLSLR